MLALVLAVVLPVGWVSTEVKEQARVFELEVQKASRLLGIPKPQVVVERDVAEKKGLGAWVYSDGSNVVYITEGVLKESGRFLPYFAYHESCHLFTGSKHEGHINKMKAELIEEVANACTVFLFDHSPEWKGKGGWDAYASVLGRLASQFYPTFVIDYLRKRGDSVTRRASR